VVNAGELLSGFVGILFFIAICVTMRRIMHIRNDLREVKGLLQRMAEAMPSSLEKKVGGQSFFKGLDK